MRLHRSWRPLAAAAALTAHVAAQGSWPAAPSGAQARAVTDPAEGGGVTHNFVTDATGAEVAAGGVIAEAVGAEPCQTASFSGSPARVYLKSLHKWLRDSPFQALVTAVVTLTGLGLAWDGPGIWNPLFTVGLAALLAGVARHEARAWSLDQVSEGLLMAQAAFLIALAAQSGFEGFQVLFGTTLGFTGAYGCGQWARWLAQWIPGLAVLWYSVGAMAGILFFSVWRKPVLSVAGPLLGGLLTASGLGLLVGRLWGALTGQASPLFPQPLQPWVSAFDGLLRPAGPAVLAGHAVCVVLAVLLHSRGRANQEEYPPLGLIGFVVITALLALVGQIPACDGRCPDWMLPQADGSPLWPVVGCCLWGAITWLSARMQLRWLVDWEAEDIWQTFCSDSGDVLRRAGYDRLASYSAAFQPQDGDPKHRRAAPDGGLDFGD